MALRVLLQSWRDLHHPESGGAEKYLDVVARGLVDLGHDVTFRTAAYPGAVARETVEGVHYVRKGGHESIYVRSLAGGLLARYRPDIVVDVQNGMPYLSPLTRHVPVVNLVHHVHREQWPVVFDEARARFGWWMESRVAPRVYRGSHYVAVSDSTRRELVDLGVDDRRVEVIHNGTDAVADGAACRSRTPMVVVLARLVPHKRVEYAIDAVAALLPELPELRLRVLGQGYWEPNLRAYAATLGVADQVEFHGHVSEEEKHRHLAEAWVHAMPSLKEGWGLVVVEAGVHGTPTLAFDHAGGPTDSVQDGRTGILVHGAYAGSAEFTAGLRRLLLDTSLRDRLSRDVVGWVERFSWGETVQRWDQSLRLLASGHPPVLPTHAGGASPGVT